MTTVMPSLGCSPRARSPRGINWGACVIVCPVEAIFNPADLPDWELETPGRHTHTWHGTWERRCLPVPRAGCRGKSKNVRQGRMDTGSGQEVEYRRRPQTRLAPEAGRDGGKGGSR